MVDDVYGNHFRCGDCSGMLTKDQAAEARFHAAAVPPASCVCAGGSKKVRAPGPFGTSIPSHLVLLLSQRVTTAMATWCGASLR